MLHADVHEIPMPQVVFPHDMVNRKKFFHRSKARAQGCQCH